MSLKYSLIYLLKDYVKFIPQGLQNKILNNKIYLYKADGAKVLYPRIKNLYTKFSGKNNTIEIYEPITITESLRFVVSGNNTKVTIDRNNKMRKVKIFLSSDAVIKIGKNCNTNEMFISLNNAQYSTLTIGDDCLISRGILIRTSDGHTIYTIDDNKAINPPKDVTIGNHVWIGARAVILKGAKIPDNTIVGANSLITKEFDEQNCIIAGNPATKLKGGVNWSIKSYFEYKKDNQR